MLADVELLALSSLPNVEMNLVEEVLQLQTLTTFRARQASVSEKKTLGIELTRLRRAYRLQDPSLAHRRLLSRLRALTGADSRVVGITSRPLPGEYFSVSDYHQTALISTANWRLLSPPPVEQFLAKEILGYLLLFSRERLYAEPFHADSRGCLFDACADNKVHIGLGLWGRVCGECAVKLKQSGVAAGVQLEVLRTIREGLKVILSASTATGYSCFISYSHEDQPFAVRLHDALERAGCAAWLDDDDLRPGERILDAVEEAIRGFDRVLLCCSRASLESWWVKDEIRKAQERERKEDRAIIIPLNLDGYLFEWQDGLASDLTSRLAADFTGWEQDDPKFEAEFERVVEALRA